MGSFSCLVLVSTIPYIPYHLDGSDLSLSISERAVELVSAMVIDGNRMLKMPAPQAAYDDVMDNYMEFDEGGAGQLMDNQPEKLVHQDFYNDFGDLFDDDAL